MAIGVSIAWLIAAAGAAAGELVRADDPQVQTQLDAWRAAQRRTRDESVFHCTYVCTAWSAASLQDAFAETAPTEECVRYRGQFSKRQSLRRISRFLVAADAEAGGDAVRENEAPDRDAGGAVQLVGFAPADQLINEYAYLSYNPPWRGAFDSASLQRIAESQDFLRSGGCAGNEFELSLLNGLPGCGRDIFAGEVLAGVDVAYEVSRPDSEHVQVRTLRRKQTGEVEFLGRCVTTLWLAPGVPVIESIEITDLRRDGAAEQTLGVERTEFRDFRDCGEFALASAVRYARQTTPQGVIRAVHWSAPDLGEREPVDADFRIPITPKTRLFGLRERLAVPRPATLGPECLADEAIIVRNRAGSAETIRVNSPPPPPPPERRVNWWLVAANLVVGGLILWALYRRSGPAQPR